MKRKKTVAVLMALCMCVVFVGCGDRKETDSSKEETKTTNTKSYDGLITDWETKASITLGAKNDIDGTGAEIKDNVVRITEGGLYSITGESENVSIWVNTKEDVKLLLNGVELTSETGPVIYGEQAESLYIETATGTQNNLTDKSDYETDEEGKSIGKAVISCKDDLIFLGGGTLTLNGNYKHCIAGNDSIYFEGGSYQLRTTAKDGVHANDLIVIDDGEFTIEAVSDCMESEGDITINGGTIKGSSQDEGIEGKENLLVNGGTIELEVTDDGLNAGSSILLKDGDITIHTSTGDAIDSNGSLQIDGGNITAYGGGVPEGGLDCDNEEVLINGGTLVVVGDVNSGISKESKQVSVLLGQYSKGDTISIVTDEEEEIMAFMLEESRSNIILSSDKLLEGKTYHILVNGEEDRTFTVDSVVVSAGGSADSMGGGMPQGKNANPPQGQNGNPLQRPEGEREEMQNPPQQPQESQKIQ